MFPHQRVRVTGRFSSLRAPAAVLAATLVLASCGKDVPEPKADSAARPADSTTLAGEPPVAPMSVVFWDAQDGSAIYLPAEGGGAQVILPPVLDDSVPKPSSAVLPPDAAPASVDLFAPSGLIGTASVGEYTVGAQTDVSAGCDAWPVVPVRHGLGNPPLHWRIALQHGVGEPMHADSIGSIVRTDSALLVVDINKAAALLPLDTSGVMRRVPFGVSKAYRFKLPGDVDVVVTVVERRLNLEASPRVERSVLVLERVAGSKALKAVWTETQYATEDDLIAVDLLGVVSMRASKRPTLFLGQDFGDGSRVQMLQRDGAGKWSVRWASAYTGC